MKMQKVGRIKKWNTPERKTNDRLAKVKKREAKKNARQE